MLCSCVCVFITLIRDFIEEFHETSWLNQKLRHYWIVLFIKDQVSQQHTKQHKISLTLLSLYLIVAIDMCLLIVTQAEFKLYHKYKIIFKTSLVLTILFSFLYLFVITQQGRMQRSFKLAVIIPLELNREVFIYSL